MSAVDLDYVVISREDRFLAPDADRVYTVALGTNVFGITTDKTKATRFPASVARQMLQRGRYHGLKPRLETAPTKENP